MENVADALKMAGAVIIFVVALSLAMYTLSRAKTVSDTVIRSSNDRSFYTYVDEDSYIDSATKYKTERIVKFDSILPTLYRYYKENYRVEFYKSDGTPLYLYTPRKQITQTNALDIDDEMQNNEYWQGSPQATKEHLDEIVKSVLWNYRSRSFKEELGIENSEDELLEELNKQTKRVIRYTIVN